ncbi:MAG: ribbon-helix-helix domain-containing protein [Opitutales bacterium]
MRTIVELPAEQLRGLSALCRREKISRAEAIRRAVSSLLEEQKADDDGLPMAFGLWKGRTPDSRQYVEQLRKEWR